jgi:hypothetical protein
VAPQRKAFLRALPKRIRPIPGAIAEIRKGSQVAEDFRNLFEAFHGSAHAVAVAVAVEKDICASLDAMLDVSGV